MEKFQNKYRISSTRLQNWDYSWTATYFVTICTKNQIPHFGSITAGKMSLSNTGVLADVFWHEIKNHTDNVELGEFVVMPNHVHGIIMLLDNGNGGVGGNDNRGVGNVETRHALSLQPQPQPHPQTIGQQRFQNQGKNTLSSIIGGYNGAVSKHANRLGLPNGWQARFHDHIIRDAQSYYNISNYILNNPLNWEKDKFYGLF